MNQKRVLIIEDNKQTCHSLVELLGRRKLNGSSIAAECAYTLAEGEAAVRNRAALRKPFHCVVSDLQFPESEPLQTLKVLRKINESTPVRALTGLDDPDIIHECRQAGIRLILKSSLTVDIMEEILYALGEKEPSPLIDQAIASNKPITREIVEVTAPAPQPFRLNWKGGLGVGLTLIPIITFCMTSGASLYKGLNDKAEARARAGFVSTSTSQTIESHTQQLADVQKHVRTLEDNDIKHTTQLDSIVSLLEKVEHKLDDRPARDK